MKNLRHINYWSLIVIPILLLSACSQNFLNRPPKDSIVDANFYQTDAEVMAATSLLYSKVWFDYNDKASFNLGDFRGGTALSEYNSQDNVWFNTTPNTAENASAWMAFFNVIGQANTAIQNIEKYAGTGVSPDIKNEAIGEARFMRAVAYSYLVMNWGAVPIITNNQTILTDTTITRNTVQSVWKFITNDMRAAETDLPDKPYATGRVTKWSAEGMLARFYLTRAGVESSGGVRNQTFLDSAMYYSNRVITLSGKSLVPNYRNLFLYNYNNNNESLFELEWVYSPGSYGTGNSTPSYLAYSPTIENGDGWGGDLTATWWMISQYAGINPYGITGDTLRGRTLDQRLLQTFMLPGASYPEITQTVNGVDIKPFIYPNNTQDNSTASIKKYIIGQSKDVGGSAVQNYPNDTYMMRLAEMYLTYAEAKLGNNASTTDPTALQYFNAVHTRAGLPALTDTTHLTFDMIFKERTIEFAMEGMIWYDLVRLHYWNPTKALAILNSQDRGLFAIYPDVYPNPTQWTFVKTSWSTKRYVTANEGNFLLPIPAAELTQAPNLEKPPVDYYSK